MSSVNPPTAMAGSGDIPDTTFGDFNEEDLVQIEMQTAGVDQQDLKIQRDEIQSRNAKLQQLQELLAKLDAKAPTDPSQDNQPTEITLSDADWNLLTSTDAGKVSGASGGV